MVTAAFSLALFTSAALLFALQPMVTRMLLPTLGGTPAVWITAMVFFQGALFAGYAYAWLVATRLTVRAQQLLHGVLLVAALAFLPIAVGDAASLNPANPERWLLMQLVTGVAIPFIVVAASTTLLQSWFAHAAGAGSTEPYALFIASNGGSLLALLAYPFLIEPALSLPAQSLGWTAGYGALLLLTAVSAWLALPGPSSALAARAAAGPTDWALRARWLLLSLVPSMLLLAVSLHISTDVASIPLLWVLPLAVYLLTFILAFVPRWRWPLLVLIEAQALGVIYFALGTFPRELLWTVVTHLTLLGVVSLLCHRTLFELRPPVDRLPSFYLWVAFGGWLGGLAGGLVAPLMFNSVLEYPLAMCLACLARFDALKLASGQPAPGWLKWIAAAALGVLLATVGARALGLVTLSLAGTAAWVLAIGVTLYWLRNRPALFALAATAVILDNALSLNPGRNVPLPFRSVLVGQLLAGPAERSLLFQDRSFFGVSKVLISPGGEAHVLYHGPTQHGAQLLDPGLRREPTMYYHRAGPIGVLIRAKRATGTLRQFGVIGLGTGALACHVNGDERMTFFEIDPTVVAIARNPTLFTFLTDCGNQPEVVLGDGRLKLAERPDGEFDLLVVDAFSSDAIPVHLITQEAVSLYLQKLKPGGVVAFNVTNKYVRLAPVLSRIAGAGGWAAAYQAYAPGGSTAERAASGSQWFVIARTQADLRFLDGTRFASMDPAAFPGQPWTDQYSSIRTAIAWR